MKIRLKGSTKLCIGFVILMLWIASLKYEQYKLVDEGYRVQVQVIDVPRRCGTGTRRSKPYFRFHYRGIEYRKDFNGQHCNEIRPGKTLILRTNKEHSVFVFEDEEVGYDVAAMLGLALLFTVCAIVSQHRKNKY
ncbi:MAG: hypothetical protein CMP77_03985 [Flavobacterium sp.]|nr:hypothetical protein [Flavobacterium sp.]|tara:strand:- start:368 stop:772 length:405 start_codon:yes stop_codon:yes gene_type:complete